MKIKQEGDGFETLARSPGVHRFRGADAAAALAAAQAQLGAVVVLLGRRLRRGGIGGVFAEDLGVEILVRSQPAPAETVVPGQPGPMTAGRGVSLVEALNRAGQDAPKRGSQQRGSGFEPSAEIFSSATQRTTNISALLPAAGPEGSAPTRELPVTAVEGGATEAKVTGIGASAEVRPIRPVGPGTSGQHDAEPQPCETGTRRELLELLEDAARAAPIDPEGFEPLAVRVLQPTGAIGPHERLGSTAEPLKSDLGAGAGEGEECQNFSESRICGREPAKPRAFKAAGNELPETRVSGLKEQTAALLVDVDILGTTTPGRARIFLELAHALAVRGDGPLDVGLSNGLEALGIGSAHLAVGRYRRRGDGCAQADIDGYQAEVAVVQDRGHYLNAVVVELRADDQAQVRFAFSRADEVTQNSHPAVQATEKAGEARHPIALVEDPTPLLISAAGLIELGIPAHAARGCRDRRQLAQTLSGLLSGLSYEPPAGLSLVVGDPEWAARVADALFARVVVAAETDRVEPQTMITELIRQLADGSIPSAVVVPFGPASNVAEIERLVEAVGPVQVRLVVDAAAPDRRLEALDPGRVPVVVDLVNTKDAPAPCLLLGSRIPVVSVDGCASDTRTWLQVVTSRINDR